MVGAWECREKETPNTPEPLPRPEIREDIPEICQSIRYSGCNYGQSVLVNRMVDTSLNLTPRPPSPHPDLPVDGEGVEGRGRTPFSAAERGRGRGQKR